ncbi:Major facilitator superfamily protein isoform 1 [Theobroma cacao]|uniref:Major facilitator superfamily protein isoform 1 n=1 Tax=Theobroma cacao TaxID=3641 RepID=A0A061DGI1_THECC|nr:Major facilitator superfamily protein isoform 1 [Theobroma cacao]EOX91177.1 Major facilitator superfamily protein isoform 1 [Theobroma cacao]EOX91178.1 Major facilitator superfamily protein isoform 1 [Theobroma cacao]
MGLNRSHSRFSAALRPKPLFHKHLQAMKARRVFGVSLSLLLINLAAIMERADENLLPSVYKEVSEAFNAGPSDLGYLTFIRNFVQGLASPLTGVLVINYDRPTVLAIGTLCWALSTAAVGASQQFLQVALWRAVNGFGLAIVIPALQSFIADSYTDGVRGAGFGLLSFVGTLGGIGGGVVATIMAGQQFWGMPGWRCAFILMATLSSLIGFLVFLFVVDPRKTVGVNHDAANSFDRDELIEKGNTGASSVWFESWMATRAVIKVPTFQIIVLQGIVGSLPWTAMVFFTMWFELIGFDHNSTAALLSLFAIGCAMGSFLGGLIADKISQIYPHSGRIMCAQFSAFMGIPFSWFLLKVIPQSVSSYYTFAVTLFLMGLTISWNATAANGPMFAEVVPAKHRTMIYAFDRAFEGSFSSFAAPLVGILSEQMFGYDSKSIDPINGSPREAFALSRGLLAMMAIPFGLCSLFYTPLYNIFRRDRDNVRLANLKEEEMI